MQSDILTQQQKKCFDFSTLPKKDLWQQAKERPVVLYGTGNGADKIMNRLVADGAAVAAVCSGAEFVRNRQFRGFHVISAEEAAQKYPDALFLLAFGTKLPSVVAQLRAFGAKVTLRAATVPVYGEEIFDTAYCRRCADELRAAYALLADDDSRRIFSLAIRFYLTGELSLLFAADSEQAAAFSQILRFGDCENFLDVGAYRGDTAEEFINLTGGKYRRVTALEPDPKTFIKLQEKLSLYPRTAAVRAGAWEKTTVLPLQTGRGKGSHAAADGVPTDFIALDDRFADSGVTYLKIDAEGAEQQVLNGARHILQNSAPKLNIALYHRTGDLFRIPLQLHDVNPNYRLYLRKHPHIPFWDFNLYAVPDQKKLNNA